MKTTMLSEARDGKITVTIRLPYAEACMLLDVVTDSVILGNTKGSTQEWAKRLMRDLDDHIQHNEEKRPQIAGRCANCGFFRNDLQGKICPNCKE
jgi:hypothetical protein